MKYVVPPKVEKHLKRNDRFWKNIMKKKKVIGFLTVALAFFLLGIIGKSVWDGYWRTHSWEVRSPFQNPLIIREIKPEAQKVLSPVGEDKKPSTVIVEAPAPLSEREQVAQMKHGEVLWKVYGLESTWGRNDYCRNNNLGFAGYGVLNEGQIVCYDSFKKATERAEYWLVKNGLEEKPLANVLCIWNQGVDTNECHYYQSYMSL